MFAEIKRQYYRHTFPLNIQLGYHELKGSCFGLITINLPNQICQYVSILLYTAMSTPLLGSKIISHCISCHILHLSFLHSLSITRKVLGNWNSDHRGINLWHWSMLFNFITFWRCPHILICFSQSKEKFLIPCQKCPRRNLLKSICRPEILMIMKYLSAFKKERN